MDHIRSGLTRQMDGNQTYQIGLQTTGVRKMDPPKPKRAKEQTSRSHIKLFQPRPVGITRQRTTTHRQHPKPKNNHTPHTYDTGPITADERRNTFKLMKNYKASEPYGVNMELLKWIPEELEPHLLQVVNTWWAQAEGQPNITYAKFSSIYKKGNPTQQENYRPISLLCSLCSIITSLIKQRLEGGIEQEIQRA